MNAALAAAVRRGRETMRPPPAERCADWAARRFRLAPESSAVPGRFDPWPHQVGLLDVMAADRVAKVTVRKSARAGYTASLLAYLAWATATRRRNTLVFLPTDDEAAEFAKDSVDPMLRDVPELGDLLARGRRGRGDTLRVKLFPGCAMHIRGGRTPNAYRRLAKDVVVYDEVDAFPMNVGGEGDPLALGDKRAADSPHAKSVRGSTPTTRGASLLERSEADADMRMAYRVECPRCGAREELAWGAENGPSGLRWEEGDPAGAHYLCGACGGRWDWADLPAALAGGRWEADDGRWIAADGRLLDPDGGMADWPRHVALRIWSAYSPTTPWADIAREFADAGDDPDKLRAFANTVRGEWWAEAVSESAPEPLLARREPYRSPPAGALAVTFGADVQADRVEVEIVAWGAGEECWSLDYRVIRGDPTGREVWDELLRTVERPWRTADGRTLRPRCGVVDSGHLADDVYRFSRRAGLRFALPGKGSSTPGAPVATLPRRPHRDHGVYIVSVGADTAKDTLYARLALTGAGHGRCHWPDDDDVYGEEYFAQLTGEEKRPVRRRGRTVLAYVQTWRRVEALDCRVYALAALRVALAQRWVDLEEPEPPAPPPPEPPPRRPPSERWIR